MSYTTLNLTLSAAIGGANGSSNTTTYTYSTTNTSFAAAQLVIQQIWKNGGMADDFGNWYLPNSILKVVAS